MPFEKGRKKTGGRGSGSGNKQSAKLIDQLARHGFNYVRELAKALKDIPPADKYHELKLLLPFMAPKLKEREVELVDPVQIKTNEKPISSEDLLKALDHGTERKPKPRPSSVPPVAERSIDIQTPPSPEVNLQDLVGEQEDN